MKMLTITYIISAIALISLALGVIVMIVVRVDPIPKWKTVCKVLIWVIGLLIFRLVFWGLVKFYQEKTTHPTIPKKENLLKSEKATPIKNDWTFEWQLPEGKYVRGLNKSGPLPAKVERRPNGDLWISVYYRQDGKTETGKMKLKLIDTGLWEGSWGQDNPPDFGNCNLNETSPGFMSGYMTGIADVPAFYKLRKN